ncbi:MAG: hypothetical protein FGF48_07605 [Candidatus Brockarchaeota archaeon]|nr:hypothetical protein [Candidatus Brockarchaeota archaeon]
MTTIKGETFNAGDRITVGEVKYVGDPGNVKEFETQIDDARKQIDGRFNDPKWTAPYGSSSSSHGLLSK